uniref:Uncharacterized protein n=1 Tax=Eutreptiella gymnastica TaxID=73025 RepID=A0A7S1ID20_9EUGL
MPWIVAWKLYMDNVHGNFLPLYHSKRAWKISMVPKEHGFFLPPSPLNRAHNITHYVVTIVGGTAARKLCMDGSCLPQPLKEHVKVLAPSAPKTAHKINSYLVTA